MDQLYQVVSEETTFYCRFYIGSQRGARIYSQFGETSYQTIALGDPYQLEFEVTKMLLKLDAENFQCAFGIIELDVPENKNGNQHFVVKNLVWHHNSEKVKAREDGDLKFFQKLPGFLSK